MSPPTTPRASRAELADADYRRLAELRAALRRFLHWSEEQAHAAGLTPAQHQLLLAIRARGDDAAPTIGQLAETLLLRHHSAVGLVDRAQEAGLVERRRDPANRSTVHVSLTARGRQRLRALSAAHLTELAQLAPSMRALWDAVER
jgi:DNA-binding MarR family transcriptional regulator